MKSGIERADNVVKTDERRRNVLRDKLRLYMLKAQRRILPPPKKRQNFPTDTVDGANGATAAPAVAAISSAEAIVPAGKYGGDEVDELGVHVLQFDSR